MEENDASNIQFQEYQTPIHWDARTPLYKGMPKLFHLYQDLNDNKLRHFLSHLNGFVLDAGCGSGRFLNYASVGVDFSKGMLERAKIHKKPLVRASIFQLPFRDKAFNYGFSVDVLLHVFPEQRKRVLNEFGRVSHTHYDFSPERSTLPIFLYYFGKIKMRIFWHLIPYFAVFLAFPLDRWRSPRLRVFWNGDAGKPFFTFIP